MTKQYFGFLVHKGKYNRLKKGAKKVTKDISIAEKAAKKSNLIPCYLCFSQLSDSPDKTTALVKKNGVYQEKVIRVPRVIYNLVWTSNDRQRIIDGLTNKGIRVFNEINYLEKYKFQKLLEEDQELNRYLPETKIVNLENLKKMMGKFNQLILKPDYGFVGRGILKLHKVNESEWCLSYQSEEGEQISWKEIRFYDTIPEILQGIIESDFYLIQNLLPLATYQGSPFDFRVATQRNGSGNWEVTGIIGKVAREGAFLTNIGQGGTSYVLDELIKGYPLLNAAHFKEQINSLALRIADLFSRYTPHIADLGFDFACNTQGDLYFIECNFLSAYKTLAMRGVLLHDDWKKIFTTPVHYARFLLDNEISGVKE